MSVSNASVDDFKDLEKSQIEARDLEDRCEKSNKIVDKLLCVYDTLMENCPTKPLNPIEKSKRQLALLELQLNAENTRVLSDTNTLRSSQAVREYSTRIENILADMSRSVTNASEDWMSSGAKYEIELQEYEKQRDQVRNTILVRMEESASELRRIFRRNVEGDSATSAGEGYRSNNPCVSNTVAESELSIIVKT